MNISNILAGALIAGGLAAAAPASATTSLHFHGAYAAGGFQNGTVTVKGALDGDIASQAVGMGGFKMEEVPLGTTNAFVAWCVDLFDWIKGGTPPVTNPITFTHTAIAQLGQNGALARVQNFFDVVMPDVATKNTIAASSKKSAGVQLALWELVYDDDYSLTSFGLAGGTEGFKATAGSDVTGFANSYLSAAQGTTAAMQVWNLTQWNGESNVNKHGVEVDAQDLVSISAIPVPAGVLLIVSAFGVAGAVRRRSTARA